MEILDTDLEELKYAKNLLEQPSLAAKLINAVGRPIEEGVKLLPDNWTPVVRESARTALAKALDLAVKTIGVGVRSHESFHKISAAASGGIAGAIGLAALPVELPVSTTLIFRSIADIARSEGEDIRQVETKLACLEVFALGGGSRSDDATETGYYAVRTSLAALVSDAARYLAGRGAPREGAPILVRLIESIAARFGAIVSEKAMVTAVPVVGAAGGALANMAFIDHFQNIARGHFIVRRLERKYGKEMVRREYEEI